MQFNSNLVDLITGNDGAAFDSEFIANSKKQPFLKKQDKFDSNETTIKVGKRTFKFDQADAIFDL